MNGKPVFVTTDYREKQLQRALLQFSRPENANLVREALKKAGREDLIGSAPGCLVKAAFGQTSNSRFVPREKSKPAARGAKKLARPALAAHSGSKGGKKRAKNDFIDKKQSFKSKNRAKRG